MKHQLPDLKKRIFLVCNSQSFVQPSVRNIPNSIFIIFMNATTNKRTSLQTKALKHAASVRFSNAASSVNCEEIEAKDLPKRELRRKLIAEIEEILQGLQEKLKEDYQQVLRRLQSIEQRAVLYGVEDVNRICVFSILKSRLENLPRAIEQSTFVKRTVQSPFRGANIEGFDYQSLQEEKLAQNTLLVYPNKWGKGFKPFHWGNGFNADDRNDLRKISKEREKYNFAFDYVKYEQTVKEVNHIFFDGYRNDEQMLHKAVRNGQTALAGIISLLALVMLTALAYSSYDGMLRQATDLAGFAAMMSLAAAELFLSVRKFIIRPSLQTEIDNTWQDIDRYFRDLNDQIKRDSRLIHKYQWRAPPGLLYLQVKFLGKVPMLDDDSR